MCVCHLNQVDKPSSAKSNTTVTTSKSGKAKKEVTSSADKSGRKDEVGWVSV